MKIAMLIVLKDGLLYANVKLEREIIMSSFLFVCIKAPTSS